MAMRGLRGGGGAIERLTARMSEDIDDDPEPEAVELGSDAEPEEPAADVTVVEDEPEPEPEPHIDTSHEDEPEPEPEAEPEPEPAAVVDLKRQLDELRGRNQQLEAVAASAHVSKLEGDHARVQQVLSAAQGAMTKAEADLAAALTANDAAAAAKAQRAIAEIAVDLRDFADAEADLKHQITEARKRPAQPRQQAEQGDQFEAYIAQNGFSEPSAAWLRKHKADILKPGRADVAKAAHVVAISKGLKVDTPEYFAAIDETMGYGAEPVTKTTSKTTAAPARRPAGKPQMAAPTNGGAPRGGVTEVRLSRDEINMARAMGMSTKDYARNKAELIKNGKRQQGPRYSNQTDHSRRY